MANLSHREKLIFEELFEMESGYVLDFTNNQFARFIDDVINIDIYEGKGYEEYCSKANKLRQIWRDESDYLVGTLMESLLEYFGDYYLRREIELSEYQIRKIDEMNVVSKRLKQTISALELPDKTEESFQTLQEDIISALARNKPTLVLDRLHTFATKLLRQTCMDNGLTITDAKGNYLPLHSLAGMLRKKYEKEGIFQATFTLLALQNSISLFDSYNDVRNNKSYAHDNEVLEILEADFAVRVMTNVISFIDNVEIYRKKIESKKLNSNDFDYLELPF